MDDTGEWILLSEEEGRDSLDRGQTGPDDNDDISRQRDEASAMAAMYGPSFSEISTNEWRFQYELAKGVVGEMRMSIPTDYPSSSVPELTLDIPGCTNLKQTQQSFLDEYVAGNEVGFAWGELFHQLCRSSADKLQVVAIQKNADRSKRLAQAKNAKTPAARHTAQQLHQRSNSMDLYCFAVKEGYRRHCYGGQVDGGPSRSELLAENRRLALAAEQKKNRRTTDASSPAAATFARCAPGRLYRLLAADYVLSVRFVLQGCSSGRPLF